MNYKDNLDTFVLAGGKSSRMGQDKGTMDLGGKPMINHITDTLYQLGITPVVIANLDCYFRLNKYEVIKDIVHDQGPMGGLYTALSRSLKSHILLMSCDTPFIGIKAIKRLIDNTTQHADAVVAAYNGRPNPLMGIYKTSIKKEVVKRILYNQLKMQDLIFGLDYKMVSMDDLLQNQPHLFLNCNNKDDLKIAIEYAKHTN